MAPGTDFSTLEPRDFSPEVLFRHARPSMVGRMVLVQLPFYGTDNSFMTDTVERYPDVFRVVGVVDHRNERVADAMGEGRGERP